jgi:Trypsin-like peptidase domain
VRPLWNAGAFKTVRHLRFVKCWCNKNSMTTNKAILISLALLLYSTHSLAQVRESSATPSSQPTPAIEPDLSTVLMQSTFQILGSGAGVGAVVSGTVFVVGKPTAGTSQAYYVLITAAHVLDSIVGQQATLVARRQIGDKWEKAPFSLKIRDDNNQPLWVKNKAADVAAMYVGFPEVAKPTRLVSTNLFASDEELQELEVRPGDRVFILGYPLNFESPQGGFSILRAGWIASYPLVPSRSIGSFLVSFEVFPGNSGGPVYLVYYNRVYNVNPYWDRPYFCWTSDSRSVSLAGAARTIFNHGTRVSARCCSCRSCFPNR